MADPIAPPETGRRATNPLLIVAGTVLVVGLVTLLLYSVGGYEEGDIQAGGPAAKLAEPAGAGACGFGQPDDSYSVALTSDPDPPRPEGTTFRLTVRQGGRAVTGAKVCISADMPSMQHPGLSTVAKEGSGGRYETVVKFGMGGSWRAAVTINEPGKPIATVTVPIEVTQVEQN
ncbi:MAG TPA: FixH family protein [Acidimicrobiales bacterium]|nr:FixH family protein [Acidimicrobiales bacterium]